METIYNFHIEKVVFWYFNVLNT